MNVGKYAKGVVIVFGATVSGLAPYYGSQHWFIGLTAGLTALAGILVPNQTAATAPATTPVANPTSGSQS